MSLTVFENHFHPAKTKLWFFTVCWHPKAYKYYFIEIARIFLFVHSCFLYFLLLMCFKFTFLYSRNFQSYFPGSLSSYLLWYLWDWNEWQLIKFEGVGNLFRRLKKHELLYVSSICRIQRLHFQAVFSDALCRILMILFCSRIIFSS